MRKSDAEIKKLYLKIDPDAARDKNPSRWWWDALRATRGCFEAATYKDAVNVLGRAGWERPEKCAKIIRGSTECPTCHGQGFIE
jgi:hypothetical protein